MPIRHYTMLYLDSEVRLTAPPPMILPTLAPVPHNPTRIQSWLLVAVLIISAAAVTVLLRGYWWGMLWALSPDILDFVILRPLTGEHPIHDLFKKVSTPWGFAVEMLLVVVVVLVLCRKGRAAPNRVL